jgi:hypothetical protein
VQWAVELRRSSINLAAEIDGDVVSRMKKKINIFTVTHSFQV